MSGIYGYLQKVNSKQGLSDKTLKSMANWNKAYGTSHGSLATGRYGMGASIERLRDDIPVSNILIENETQIAVIDAVLYNRDELMGKMGIASAKLISDEELLILFIKKYGYKALSEVNGDFAGAVFDKKADALTLFRDHMGIRPLFYYCHSDFVAFSTDIRGIVAIPESDIRINGDWIYKTAVGAVSIDQTTTEYENIEAVKPGSYIRICFSDGKMKREETTYWRVGSKKIKRSTDEEYQRELRRLIEDAVKRRLGAVSGSVGAELSGGLDSGVIDILINRSGRKCFYYSWSDSPKELEMAKGDERYIIQDICNQEKIDCYYGSLSIKEDSAIFRKTKETGIEIDMEELPAIRYALPPLGINLKITQTAEDLGKLGTKVVFTGHGGDEGVSHRANPYEMFRYHEYYHYFRYMFSTTKGRGGRIKATLKKCRKNLVEDRKAFEKPFTGPCSAKSLLKASFEELYNPKDMQRLYFAYDPIAYINQGGSRNRLDAVALLGAYSGVRYLVPFLDYRVVDYAVSIPRYQYLRGRKDRYIFREAFRDIMPDSLYRLHTKAEPSRDSYKPDPDWFRKFDSEKKALIDKLDRKQWEQYLDFDEIDAWRDRGEPKGEDVDKENNMYMCLFLFVAVRNIIDKIRK